MELEKLMKYGIFVLREYARTIGVKPPTILNKHDLIEEILLVINGEKQPVFNSKRGRPVNRLTFETEIQRPLKETIAPTTELPAPLPQNSNTEYKKQLNLLRRYLYKSTDILIELLSR